MRSTRTSRCSLFRCRACCISGVSSRSAIARSRGGLRRFGPIVQATIATAIRSATNASRKNHTILSRSLRSLVTRRAASALRRCIVDRSRAARTARASRRHAAAGQRRRRRTAADVTAPPALALAAGEVLARRLERAAGLDRGHRRRNLARLSRGLRGARRVARDPRRLGAAVRQLRMRSSPRTRPRSALSSSAILAPGRSRPPTGATPG